MFGPRRPRPPHPATIGPQRAPFASVARPAPYVHSVTSSAVQRAALLPVPAAVTVHLDAGGAVTGVRDGDVPVPFALDGTDGAKALRAGGVTVAPRAGGKFRVMFLRGASEWSPVASVAVVRGAAPLASASNLLGAAQSGAAAAFRPAAARAVRPLHISVANGWLREEPCVALKFSAFSDSAAASGHLAKHGHEVGADSLATYLRAARAFGDIAGEAGALLREATIGGTQIRVDPESARVVRVLIVNNRQARTFYVWDRAFSSDPFVYAIFYTITANLRMSIRDLPAADLEIFDDQAVDLFAMESELIDRRLAEGRSIPAVAAETCAPLAVVSARRRNRGVHRMEAELARADEGPQVALDASARLFLESLRRQDPPPVDPRQVDAEALALFEELAKKDHS